MKFIVLGVALSLLVSCVSPPPPEFAVYTAAFDQSKTAAFATIEIWEPIEKAQRPPTENQFLPDEATYIADEGRAGNAVLIERGFASISAYNEILARYAAGESVSTLKPAAGEFATNVGALALTVGLPGVGAGVSAAVKGLETIASALLAVSNREEFARAVKANSGKVDAFLFEVRGFTTDMYQAARTHSLERKLQLLTENRRADAAKIPADLENFRKMLASWVLTIDEARNAIGALEAAVVAGEGAGISLSQVTFWTGEINRHAEAVKFAAHNISVAFDPPISRGGQDVRN